MLSYDYIRVISWRLMFLASFWGTKRREIPLSFFFHILNSHFFTLQEKRRWYASMDIKKDRVYILCEFFLNVIFDIRIKIEHTCFIADFCFALLQWYKLWYRMTRSRRCKYQRDTNILLRSRCYVSLQMLYFIASLWVHLF